MGASLNSDLEINSIGIFSIFPFFWKDLNSKQPRNIFFNRLPYEFAKTHNVTHVIWILPWKKLIANRDWLRKLKIDNKIYFLENKINIIDALSLFKINIFIVMLSILFEKNNCI